MVRGGLLGAGRTLAKPSRPAADPSMSIIAPSHAYSDWSCSAFIEKSYLGVKEKNPDLPILIREALGTPPRAFARFGEHLAHAGFVSTWLR